MNFKQIKKVVFLGIFISCLASFSLVKQTLAHNEGFIVDSQLADKLQSAYTPDFLFLKALAQAYGLSVPNFDDTSYVDALLESKQVLELMYKLENYMPDFNVFDQFLESYDFTEEKLSLIHRRLLLLPNGAKLVELFDKSIMPRLFIFAAEINKSFHQKYQNETIELSDNARFIFISKLITKLSEFDFSENIFQNINHELETLSNGSKLIDLLSIAVEKEIKPYINESKFEQLLFSYLYPTYEMPMKHVKSISESDVFFIRDAIRRPYSERAKLILGKLDTTGELNRLYEGFFK